MIDACGDPESLKRQTNLKAGFNVMGGGAAPSREECQSQAYFRQAENAQGGATPATERQPTIVAASSGSLGLSLLARRLPKTTIMSIGHRSAVVRLHQRHLEMCPEGDHFTLYDTTRVMGEPASACGEPRVRTALEDAQS